MEKPTELEVKYQKLATEYSKVRSQATVLKKALLEEQAKSVEYKEQLKKHEQNVRKHNQEMESLTFRNEQLTKRISVLQQELQSNSNSKKKNKSSNEFVRSDFGVLDEELQKKILENAQLVSSMADKNFELNDSKERISWLESKIKEMELESLEQESKHLDEIKHLNVIKNEFEVKLDQIQGTDSISINSKSINSANEESEEVSYWKVESERWRSECEVLRSRPQSEDKLTDYYESHLRQILESKRLAQSECKTVWAENKSLYARVENMIVEHKETQYSLEKSNDELLTTIDNYKSQLDAMTEHLAAQNDKITKQCDDIQALRHKLSTKK